MPDRGNTGSKVCACMCSLESVCAHACVHSGIAWGCGALGHVYKLRRSLVYSAHSVV